MLVISLAVLLAAAACIVAGCGSSSDTASTTTTNDSILRIAANSDCETGWDIRAAAPPAGEYLANMYETLLRINPQGSAEPYEPVLATSWESSDDGLEWTFHLREGVTFHDGEPFNAQAVKFSLESTMKLGQGSAYILAPIEKIQVVDDSTVKFTLNQSAPLEKILGSEYGAYMYSPATKSIKKSEWKGHSYGTGPYKVVKASEGEQYVFDANKDYWGGWKDDQYQKIDVRVVKDAGTQRQLLESGEVDFVDIVDRDSVEALSQSPTVTVNKVDSMRQYCVCFNTGRAPLTDKVVRQALSWALPYDDIIELGTAGYSTKSVGYVPESLFPYNADLPQYTTDLAKAKQLLADAGYANGEGIHTLDVIYYSEDAVTSKFAPLVKEAWEELGIKVNLHAVLASQGFAQIAGPENKRQDVVIETEYPSFPAGYDMLYYQFHTQPTVSFNSSYWASGETDKLMDQAWALEPTDTAAAKQLYDECQQILIDNAPTAPVCDPLDIYASAKTLAMDEGALSEYYPKTLFWYKVRLASGE
jgi:peptide/nickel transport system substrate-binding protein